MPWPAAQLVRSAQHAGVLHAAATTAAAVLPLHVRHQLHWVGEGLAAVWAALKPAAAPAARRLLPPNAAAAPAPRVCGFGVLDELLHGGKPGAALLAALQTTAAGWLSSRARQVNHVRRLPAALLLLLLSVLLQL